MVLRLGVLMVEVCVRYLRRLKGAKWEEVRRGMVKNWDRDVLLALKVLCHSKRGCPATYEEVSSLVRHFPMSPMIGAQKRRAETLAIEEGVSLRKLSGWFLKFEPETSGGRVLYMESLRRKGLRFRPRLESFVKKVWREDYLTRKDEEEVLKYYGEVLHRQDHNARLEQMLWQGFSSAARRQGVRVGGPREKRGEARLALQGLKPGVDGLIKRVRKSYHDGGLVFDRVKWRWRKGKKEEALALALSYTERDEYAENWYGLTEKLKVYALVRGRVLEAERLLRMLEGKEMSRASSYKLWRDLGYISLLWKGAKGEKLHEERLRYKQALLRMQHAMKYAESLSEESEISYWLGRIYEGLGNKSRSRYWYENAGRGVTFFYGQVALRRLGKSGDAPYVEPRVGSGDAEELGYKRVFLSKPLVRIATKLHKAGIVRLSRIYLHHMINTTTDPRFFSMAAQLAYRMNHVDAGVYASRVAEEQGLILNRSGYPWIRLRGTESYPSLIMALVRQESSFNVKAKSSSGARGLMQLMPQTARYVSRKRGLPFAARRLTEDPHYNILLGDWYLDSMLERFGGHLVLALSAYNAGPGSVERWLKSLGRPGVDIESTLAFIERIPYGETKRYVKKVLANFTMYRRLRDEKDAKLVFMDEARG
jgi:soluble lytic murein transglycosylase